MADGVGGWRNYGIDPSAFPRQLMATCQRLVEEGHFRPQAPASIIAASYEELQQHKDPLLGQLKHAFTLSFALINLKGCSMTLVFFIRQKVDISYFTF